MSGKRQREAVGTCGDGQDLGRRGVGLSARSASRAWEGLWTRNEPGERGAGEAVRGCDRDPEGSRRGVVERGWGAECSPGLRVTMADVSAGPATLYRWEPSRAGRRVRMTLLSSQGRRVADRLGGDQSHGEGVRRTLLLPSGSHSVGANVDEDSPPPGTWAAGRKP